LSIEEIIDKLAGDNNKDDILLMLKDKIITIVMDKLPPVIPSVFRRMISKHISSIIDEEGDKIITEFIEDTVAKATTNIQLSKMIEDRINKFEMEELERIALKVVKTELRHIEILGGVLGFIIGIFQGIIILLL
jgi:uncharacterized membrane protein YheB (UPF0754 family)